MFCTRCGKEITDDASFCASCGASLGQMPGALVLEQPSTSRTTLWIAIAAAILVALTIAISIAVLAWVIDQSDQSGHVIVDGMSLVGADGEPIELVRNSAAADPTWAQLRQFLSTDQTDRIPYNDSTFVCGDSAERLFNNAEKAGIRVGYVFIEFENDATAHACNAFQTTDRGIVYIDDTGTTTGSINADKTVDLTVGKSYCPEAIFSNPGHEVMWECMGAVSSFSVTW